MTKKSYEAKEPVRINRKSHPVGACVVADANDVADLIDRGVLVLASGDGKKADAAPHAGQSVANAKAGAANGESGETASGQGQESAAPNDVSGAPAPAPARKTPAAKKAPAAKKKATK